MMGQREGGQGQFFYAFDLDKAVPGDHLVRQIDASLGLSWESTALAGDQRVAWPEAGEASRAVREYLMALDAARSDEESGGDDTGSNGGGSRGKPPKEVSLTDPQAAWVARKGTDPFFAYDANYLIDNKAG